MPMTSKYNMSKILDLLQNFITSLLCNTSRRFAAKRAREIGTNLVESYIFVLQEKVAAIETQDGIHNHIGEFSTYCAAFGQHMTYEELIREVTIAFCPQGVVKQLGTHRNQIISRNIFVNTFKESAAMLMRTSEILDMVANGADNAVVPCQKIVKSAISNLKSELMTNTSTALGTAPATTVPSKIYDLSRQKYDQLISAYHKKDLDLTNAIKKIKELADYLKKVTLENQSLRNRMREIETRPRELFVPSTFGNNDNDRIADKQNTDSPIIERTVQDVSLQNDHVELYPDDSVSCISRKSRGSFIGSLSGTEPKIEGKHESKTETKSDTKKSKKPKKKPAETVFDDENDFNPDDLDSFF